MWRNAINLNLRSNFSRMFTFSSRYIAPLCQRVYGCVCGTFLLCVVEMFRKEILTGGWTHSLWWQWASNNYSRIFWCWKIPEMSNKHWNSIIKQLRFGAQPVCSVCTFLMIRNFCHFWAHLNKNATSVRCQFGPPFRESEYTTWVLLSSRIVLVFGSLFNPLKKWSKWCFVK